MFTCNPLCYVTICEFIRKKGLKDYRRRNFLLIIPIFLNLDVQKYTTFAIKDPFIIVFHTGYIHN